MLMPRVIVNAADVTPDVIEAAIELTDDWYADERVDWEEALLRLEKYHDWDLGESMESPAIKKIQREVRAHRRAEGMS